MRHDFPFFAGLAEGFTADSQNNLLLAQNRVQSRASVLVMLQVWALVPSIEII
jgi:hypothetical protein